MSLKSASVRQPFLFPGKTPCRSASLTCAAGQRQCRSAESTRQPMEESFNIDATTALLGSAGLLTPLLLDVETALAQKGEYGIVEGRIASMTHPIMMGFLFGASLYTAWLGFQWRYVSSSIAQIRTCISAYCPTSMLISQQISDLSSAFRQTSISEAVSRLIRSAGQVLRSQMERLTQQ